MNKTIANVVFYKFWDPTREEPMQQACIFYEDGSVQNVSHEEGLDAAYEIAKVDKIKTRAEFSSIINTRRVFALEGSEFERRFKEFLGKGVALVPAQNVNHGLIVTPTQTNQGKNGNTPVVVPPVTNTPGATNASGTPSTPANNQPAGATPASNDAAKQGTDVPPVVIVPPVTNTPGATNTTGTPSTPANNQPAGATPASNDAAKQGTDVPPVVIVPPVTNTTGAPNPAGTPSTPTNNTPAGTEPSQTTTDPATKKPTTAEEKAAGKKKKKGLFSRLWAKVTAVILAIAMVFTGGFLVGRNTKSGDIINNNISINTQDTIQPQDQAYLNLIKKSTNADQKATMTHQSQSLDLFNRDFATEYIEEGKEIKAALTWEEMMALNLAYNTYTKDQIRIMFNGSEVDSTAMSNAYKNATLQLMGAYVISDREHPVNSSQFLVNEEERAFVEKYNDLFLKMKETTGAERVAAINAFYAELYKDFPIADEVREEGISHADARRQVEPYKAAVTPIVAASEIMFQNTDGIDHTLSDKAIAYFNDLGLCNLVDEQFERAETITLSAETDESQPLYEEFRQAKITELIYEGNYPISDERRDLSQLDAFQQWVNGHFLIVDGVNTGTITPNVTTTTTTRTETTTHTQTTTTVTDSRQEAGNQAGEDAVKKAEQAVDAELEAQNAAAKAAAEKAAAEEAARQQAIADAERAKHEAEVAEDDADMQKDITDANNTINQGGSVNEDAFGDHNVDFDPEHSDGNGNLDPSVGGITTDGTGAVDENEPLPDPNQTGAIFDGQATGTSATSSASYTATDTSSTTAYSNASGQEIYEYEEEYTGGFTSEEEIDAYIASLDGQGAEEAGYQYHK